MRVEHWDKKSNITKELQKFRALDINFSIDLDNDELFFIYNEGMNILLTGGAGYIGSHTLVELLNAGHQGVVVDNLINSSRESIKRVEEITSKKVPFYELDLRNKKALDKVFKENDIDAVIHFAGLKAVGESVEKPLEYSDNNLSSPLRLFEVM